MPERSRPSDARARSTSCWNFVPPPADACPAAWGAAARAGAPAPPPAAGAPPTALLDAADVLLQHLPEQDDALVRAAEVLARAVGDGALRDPGGHVLRRVAIQQVPLRLLVGVQRRHRHAVEGDVLGALVGVAVLL